MYISYVQDDWVNHLPMAKFAANNHVNASTNITLFFADNGFYLCMGVKPSQANQKTSQKTEFLAADKIIANQ